MRYLLLGSGNEFGKRINFPKLEGDDGRGSPEEDFSSGTLVKSDIDPDVNPDVVWDLDQLPYPWADNEFDEIHAYEVLEHTGTQGDGKFFFAQFAELWRILKPNGYLMLSVPMWDSEVALGVPDHKRVLPRNIFGFLEPSYYDNLGKPGYADYRKWLGTTHFKVLSYKETDMSLYMVMQAIKPVA